MTNYIEVSMNPYIPSKEGMGEKLGCRQIEK